MTNTRIGFNQQSGLPNVMMQPPAVNQRLAVEL